jgi:hypothetical protein
VPFHYITVDDATVAVKLAEATAGKHRVKLVVWTHGDHVDADPRGVLPFLLERFGRQVDEQVRRGYRILTYELDSAHTDFRTPPEFVQTEAGFANGTRIIAHAHAPRAPSGEPVWVAVQWRARPMMEADLKVSLRLLDAGGHLVGQSDEWLLSNEHERTSQWAAGETVTTYHLLSSLPGAMPGSYELGLVLYDGSNGEEVPLTDESGTPLGRYLTVASVEIMRPDHPSEIEPPQPVEPVGLAPGLRLVGYDLDRGQAVAGEELHLALYWDADQDVAADHSVVLELLDAEEQAVSEWVGAPSYPTSEWRSGDRWFDWRGLALPLDIPPGTYSLAVRLDRAVTEAKRGAIVDQIRVEGRSSLSDVPSGAQPAEIPFENGIWLLGYDLGGAEVRSGGNLRLTLYWRADRQVAESYTVFTHLLDQESRLWGQKDSLPVNGALPTTSWIPGEVIADGYDIPVSPEAPPGDYVLEIGMYQAETGQRLQVVDLAGSVVADHIILDSPIRIVP